MYDSKLCTKPCWRNRFLGKRTHCTGINLRRSATEAQLGLEFGGVSKMEFEFEFLFRPGLKFAFELECEFEFDFEFKSEFAFEVALELEFELPSSPIHLPAFL